MLPPTLEPSSPAWQDTPGALSLSRLIDMTRSLSSVEDTVEAGGATYNVRVLHSSGGAAGGVVSEGQGYALFMAGAVAAALPSGHPRKNATVSEAYEYFLGWRRMCELTSANSCQNTPFMCDGGKHECLPSWKFDDRLTREVGTGSAPDGDEDAILGMILLLLATQASPPPWWDELARWTYDSCKSFLAHLTQVLSPPTHVTSTGAPLRVLKLGSCWGGWSCVNPSYMAPGHYRSFRDFNVKYAPTFATTAEGVALAANWDELIETSYLVLNEAQCGTTGLVTNWWVPSQSTSAGAGGPSCSGSGTPAAEFGSEASRTAWRVAVDAVWYGDPVAIEWCRTLNSHVTAKLTTCSESWSCSAHLDTGCAVDSIHSGWLDNAFMLGPVLTSLMVPLPNDDPHASTQQAALDWAANRLARWSINDYYSGSWIAISTLTLSDSQAIATILRTLGDSTYVAKAPSLSSPSAPSSPALTPSPSTVNSIATTPPPSPTAADSCNIAKWDCCGGFSCTNSGCCSQGASCFAKDQWYHQCRDECPTTPESDGLWDCATRRRRLQGSPSVQKIATELESIFKEMAHDHGAADDGAIAFPSA